MEYKNPSDYLPHAAPMVLIDKVIEVTDDSATTQCYLNDTGVLKPFLEKLEKILNTNMKEELITPQEAFEMYCSIQKQYTDSILLISKIQEIINYKEKF